MKKTLLFHCFSAAFLGLAFSATAQSQDPEKELAAFAQQFQDTYNREDHATLQTYYTADAVRVAQDGTSISGAEQIAAYYAGQFKGADVSLTIVQTGVHWSDAQHAYVTKGTYRVSGTSAKGDKIEVAGSYSNVMLWKDGAWKIDRSVLGE